MGPEPSRPILGAYHVALFPPWREVVEAQCGRIRGSGLLEKSSRILVGVVGDPREDLEPIARWLGPRAEVRHLGPLSAYEFPTLQWLHDEAKAGPEDLACWYVHTKAISHGIEAGRRQRAGMEALILDNHATCLELLEGHDACGPDWKLTGFGRAQPHFAGNFWWANARYLRRLPPPMSLPLDDRYQAEFWIGLEPEIRPFGFVLPSDPFDRPSAWIGLEAMYRGLMGDIGPVRRIVDLGVDYGFSTFHFARDFPEAEVLGIDLFTLHDDAEAWVRSHLHHFPNVRILKEPTTVVGLRFCEPVDLLHIDADHAFESVVRDFSAWLHVVRLGGCVLFHDIESFPQVRAFFDGLGGVKREILEHHGLGCWVKS